MMRLLRCVCLCVVLLASGLHARVTHAQVPVAPLTGRLDVIWGDPPSPDEPPVLRFMLTRGDGRIIELSIDDALLEARGGIMGLNGRHVSIEARGGVEPTARLGVVNLRTVEAAAVVAPVVGAAPTALATVSRRYVTVLCRFADSADHTPYPPSHYETLMGAAYPGVNHYWTEVTENRINLDGSVVVGWYNLPSPRSAYLTAGGNADLGKLATDCTAAADADVNFPSFFGINLQFNRNLDCCSWGGGRTMTLDGVTRFYAMTWEAEWASVNAGTYAHEVGHSLGLPHSGGPYGRTYDSRWDVMSSSSWYPVPNSVLRTGTQTNGYHKMLLSVVPPERLVVASEPRTTVRLERTALPRPNDNAQLILVPIPSDSRIYYTVEARHRVGYDSPLSGEAVVIHRVQTPRAEPSRVVDVDGNGNVNDAGAMWVPGETFRDVEHGIAITVDSVFEDAFVVTVDRNAFAAMRVTPPSRTRTVQSGTTAIVRDSALVTGADVAWQATTRGGRLRIMTPAGQGSAMLRWQVDASALAPRLYVDTIRIVTSASVWPALLIDSLNVTAPPAQTLTMTATVLSRSDSIVVARAGFLDSVRVSFHGPGAATAQWTATRSLIGTTFYSSANTGVALLSGTGDASIRWYHFAGSRGAGTYVDTLRITAPGAANSPLLIVDTLRIFEPPVFTAGARRSYAILPQGAPPTRDSVRVALNGRWSSDGIWFAASMRPFAQRYISPLNSPLTGSGFVHFTRAPGSREPGIYVDSLRFTTAMSTGVTLILVDTLQVTAAPIGIALAMTSRRDSVVIGSSQSADSVLVIISGPNASTREWEATARAGRITIANRDAFTAPGVGIGTSWLRWLRNMTGRVPGTYVDTITVTRRDTAQSVILIDTLVVYAPLAAYVSASARAATVLAGGAAPGDSVQLALSGMNAARQSWSAHARGPWLRLETNAGAGPGTLRWSRTAAGLTAGTYTDTITVFVRGAAGSPIRIIDVLRIVNPMRITTGALRGAVMGAAYADTLRASEAVATQWSIAGGALPRGLALDTASGVISGVVEEAGEFRFQVRASALGADTTAALVLRVTKPSLTESAVLEQLLLRRALPPEHAHFLDLLGNRNGRVDVGDVRAWLQDIGRVPRGALQQVMDAAAADTGASRRKR